MIHFKVFLFLGSLSLLETAHAEDFSTVQEKVVALHRIEERLLPELDAFIVKKGGYLKELVMMINQTATLKEMTRESVQSHLGSPLNQYFLIKRFTDDWGTLEDYLNSDTSSDGKFVFIRIF